MCLIAFAMRECESCHETVSVLLDEHGTRSTYSNRRQQTGSERDSVLQWVAGRDRAAGECAESD
jgi:hypothetical protein